MLEFEQKALLKRYEPILKFTRGERFFPCDVADYVSEASLWMKIPEKPPEELVPESELDLAGLGSLKLKGANAVHFLQFISPMNLGEMAEFRFNELREALKNRHFKPTRSRLARVGYLARMMDSAFSLLLLLRGRVPGDSMAAAVITYNKLLEEKREFKYYGRVVHQDGWVILQYWYFYPFNNWRTGFFGANDHEADWEMVNIYCYQDQRGEIHPDWVAYAVHNFVGDDLRRHWDDPELEKVDEHPVVYVGGGSHASYYQTGEYLTQLSLPFLTSFKKIVSKMAKLFGQLFQDSRTPSTGETDQAQMLTIPFVDYALGDGVCIGPGCEETWEMPTVIEPAPDWVTRYRGLWGYYAQDPFSGEDAPAGPRYNRDGTVRKAWNDPVGWAGMGKVVPLPEQDKLLSERIVAVESEIKILDEEIQAMQKALIYHGLDVAATQDIPHMQAQMRVLKAKMEVEEVVLTEKHQQLTIKQAMVELLEQYAEEISHGKQRSLRAHIQHTHHPQPKSDLRFRRLAEIWAAISIGIMMIALVLLIVFARQFLLVGLAAMLLMMMTVEAAFTRSIANLVRWVSIVLAIFGLVILLLEFFWFIILVIVIIIGFYMIIQNLRELFARH